MSDVVDRLINGFFEYETEKLVFSVPKIEENLKPNDVFEGSFTLTAQGGQPVNGSVYSSCMRLISLTPSFHAARFEVKYGFDSTGLEPGAVIKGDIQIVSDAGEYYIPFVFHIVRNSELHGNQEIKNLFHFSNSAQMNFRAAVHIFYSENFLSVFEGNDRVHYDKYRGFSTKRGDAQNVDLFLRAVRKKQAVEYKTDLSVYEFSNIVSDLKCTLAVKKSTWGYIDLRVSTDCSFIRLEKTGIIGEDFLGNIYNLSFLIAEEALHEGKNFGTILLSLPDGQEQLRVVIVASKRIGKDPKRIRRREMNALTHQLMRHYVAFRMKQIQKLVWIKESLKIVERMNALNDKNPVSRLYQAQLLLMQDRTNEAKWILEHIERDMRIKTRGDEIYSYFLYLAAMFNREEAFIDKITAQIREAYENHGKSFRLLWLLLYLDADLAKSPPKRLSAIKEQFEAGCISPLLYVEAYNCIVANPSLMTELSEFELSILHFALKNGKLDQEVMERVLMLSEKLKHAPALLIEVFRQAYQLEENTEIVRILCALLIKDNVTDEKYFEWYARGVEADLKITRLYEYYMFSVPFDHRIVIPKTVILYFSLSSDLSYERTAFLYANLIRHRGRQHELYESMLDKMRQFASEQIELENINRNLAMIYKHLMVVQMITPKLAGHFLRILFSYELAVSDPRFTRVVIIQAELKGEQSYPIEDGYAYPVIYSRNVTVFLEDAKGRRTLEESARLIRVLDDTLYLEEVRKYVTDLEGSQSEPSLQDLSGKTAKPRTKAGNAGFHLYICTVRNRYVYVDADNVDDCRQLVESEDIIDAYKADIRIGLMQYYYDNGEYAALDEYLLRIDAKKLRARDRVDYIDMLVRRGMYERAYETITIYGAEELPAKICVRICSQMIAAHDDIEDPMLVKFAYFAFLNGKYDLLTLQYLVQNFKGLTKELRNLWKAARRFEVECDTLVEELLIQMMYTGTMIGDKEELFEAYVKRGSGSRLELAFLSYEAYEYFAKERLLPESIFRHMLKNHDQGEEINDACKLALLKHFAEEDASMTVRISEVLSEFLIDFLHRNIYYNFFKAYKSILPELSSYEDKTVIEYRTDPSHRVFLHYLIADKRSENERYLSEEMKCLFGGVFSREFILFFGDTLQYYIMEEVDGEEKLTFSDSVEVSETISGDDSSRYHILNDMVVARNLQDEGTLVHLMTEYAKKDYYTEKGFTII
ncbi:MAG: DUF5717 family protein [Lachnospiraceae bacterium]|nr:DUF5717 family protein [Lachnospiraceae bacterium]